MAPLLAGGTSTSPRLATPLVLSVHSVVSWDFAVSLIPGWHGTIFAPYFVAGAIYSGVGMVVHAAHPAPQAPSGSSTMITDYHFDNMSKLTLLTGTILFYAYGMEYFVAWYSGNTFEQTTFWRRAFGPMWWGGWAMIICNAFVSQLLWFRKVRTNLTALFVHLDLHQHRDVVRALRDHQLADERLRPLRLGTR